jgi:hypothetical protein
MGYSFLDALICVCFLLFFVLVERYQDGHADLVEVDRDGRELTLTLDA